MQKKRLISAAICVSILLISTGCGQKFAMSPETEIYQNNKVIPKQISKEAKIALSYYPELQKVPIEFRFKEDIKKSFMQAQPKFTNLFHGKDNRSYFVFISSKVNIEGEDFSVEDIPAAVLIGWLGHELGHIIDYRERSAFGLMIFGMRYVTSEKYIMEAERVADTHAVEHGMGDYILKTKNFILNHTDLSESYKNRLRRLYLSPEEIVVLVNNLEKDLEKAEEGGG